MFIDVPDGNVIFPKMHMRVSEGTEMSGFDFNFPAMQRSRERKPPKMRLNRAAILGRSPCGNTPELIIISKS